MQVLRPNKKRAEKGNYKDRIHVHPSNRTEQRFGDEPKFYQEPQKTHEEDQKQGPLGEACGRAPRKLEVDQGRQDGRRIEDGVKGHEIVSKPCIPAGHFFLALPPVLRRAKRRRRNVPATGMFTTVKSHAAAWRIISTVPNSSWLPSAIAAFPGAFPASRRIPSTNP